MGNYVELIGLLGMAVVLINLYLLETGREKAKSRMYLSIGLTGSLILVYYSYVTGSMLFSVLNLVFVVVNGYWLFNLFEKKPGKKVRKRK
ncbi:MAG: hypothetical protein ACM3IJ_00830 [Candidatus Levyibacteriota bacterium]